MSDINFSRENLRKTLRVARNSLNRKQQAEAAIDLLRLTLKLPQFLKAKRIAVYLSNDGEMDLTPLIHQAWAMGKQVYLPVIKDVKTRELWFALYTPETQLITNRFKILEPDPRRSTKLPTHLLDIIFMPLVGFDEQGNRLGMGGGFYDTTLSFKNKNPNSKPLLIGVAHECQRVNTIDAEEWDVKLNLVVTDKNTYL